jgi:hypothetical protein
MPVTSFVHVPDVELGGRAPRPRRPKPKPRTTPPRLLTPQVRTLLLDRTEQAIEAGRIAINPDDLECEQLDLTLAELGLLYAILFPEEYLAPPLPAAAPSGTAPGSAARIEEYARRAAAGQALYHPADATAHGAHDRGLRIAQRANGSGVRVEGWQGEE